MEAVEQATLFEAERPRQVAIASRMLGSHRPAEVDAGWRALYRANLAAIGEDPDLVRTGTVLHVPAPLSGGDPATSTTTRKDAS